MREAACKNETKTKPNKQTNISKQTNEQTNKQTNKQIKTIKINKQTYNLQMIQVVDLVGSIPIVFTMFQFV